MKAKLVTLCFSILILGAIVFTANSQSVMGPGFHDDLSGHIDYSGWTYFSNAQAFEGGSMWSNVYGETASFTFYGDSIRFFYTGSTGTGNVTICIDGGCLNHSMYSATLTTRLSISYQGLDLDEHTVTLTKNENNGAYINLDGVRIGGDEPETTPEVVLNITIPPIEITVEVIAPTPAWRSEFDLPSSGQTVAVDYTVSMGEIVMVIMSLGTFLSVFIILGVWITYYSRKVK